MQQKGNVQDQKAHSSGFSHCTPDSVHGLFPASISVPSKRRGSRGRYWMAGKGELNTILDGYHANLSQHVARYPADNVDPSLFPSRHLPCEICGSSRGEKDMLICDRCDKGFHTYCLEPPLPAVPDGDWFCPVCCGQSPPARKPPRGRGRPRKIPRVEPAAGP